MAQVRRSRTLFCSREKKLYMAALSPAEATRGACPASPHTYRVYCRARGWIVVAGHLDWSGKPLIRVQAEYQCFPLWFGARRDAGRAVVDAGYFDNVPPEALGLPAELCSRLDDWAREWDSIYPPDDPASASFESAEAEEGFHMRGLGLTAEVGTFLAERAEVCYRLHGRVVFTASPSGGDPTRLEPDFREIVETALRSESPLSSPDPSAGSPGSEPGARRGPWFRRRGFGRGRRGRGGR